MKHFKTGLRRSAFKVLASTRSSQAAIMTLWPGESSGPLSNELPRAEQWLFVVRGTGRALVNGRRTRIKSHSLLLIEKHEAHQIQNTGKTPLVTIDLYV